MKQDHAREVAGAATVSTGKVSQEEPAAASVMGRDILVTGNIEATVDLMIEGRVIGDVTCATLVLGQDSSINGSIRAERVRVSGTVEGAVDTVDLAIEGNAKVKGDITYTRLRIATGAVIEGTLIHRPGPPEEGAETKLKLVEPPQPAPPKPTAPPRYFE
ncbi:MAG: cell shape determination protein CcmA [Sphingomonas bacterium]|uniref:bactofilin family protein n=1 Tax=Sphingomonas bacterium TaxID=1895847 RepID=UPI00262A5053|nr:polymer-forming cytoskeletal protein [Sphingomonas bacterium]MDB5694956.1 cell shape determination protein CcmA [Sphingomonas bacterium]